MRRKRIPAPLRKGYEELTAFHLARATAELETAREHAARAGIPSLVFDRMIKQQYLLRNDANRSLELH